MIIFLIIYVLGIIATLLTYYHNLRSGYEVSLSELSLFIMDSLLSWIAFFILLMVIYGDEIIFTKK
jgi:hypothetical protein